MMATYLNTGSTQTPVRGRGKRTSKRNERYLENIDDNETPVSVNYNDISHISFKILSVENLACSIQQIQFKVVIISYALAHLAGQLLKYGNYITVIL